MPRRAKGDRKKAEDVYTHIEIRVDGYEANADASLNYQIYNPQHAISLDEREPVYRFTTRLVITGTATYPTDRAGHVYELTVYGDDASRYVQLKLEDIQVRDERGTRQYRTYRGRQVPIYIPPHGLGLLEKERGKTRWRAWINALPHFVTDMLTLLGTGRTLYIALEERKADRVRWVKSVSLQTNDPSAE